MHTFEEKLYEIKWFPLLSKSFDNILNFMDFKKKYTIVACLFEYSKVQIGYILWLEGKTY